MVDIGFTLSSEEHEPNRLVEHAVRAEEVGFGHALISDHFHPWTSEQGNAPFVWSTLGGVATATEDIEIGTGVTAPIQRIHPAIVAQAAATTKDMFDGRFFLGVGTGENLNEHILGDRWPPFDLRMEKLEEAVDVMRKLWTGEDVTHRGDHYTVENAKLFTLPDEPPEVYVSGTGPKSAHAAGEFGDGLISTAPNEDVVETFQENGDGPRYAQMTVCWADSEEEAKETAANTWPIAANEGELNWLLPTPKHFEQVAEMADPDEITSTMVLGNDPDDHVEMLQEFVDAGFDHVYVHQVGEDHEGFFEGYESEVLPSFE